MYDVCVIGLGYIGLPTAILFANRGLRVFGVDVREDVVHSVNAGVLSINEPGLDEMLSMAVSKNSLRAGVHPESASVYVIAVPTPLQADKSPDISYIEAAASSLASVLASGALVILESTSPVGTTERLEGWLKGARADLSFPTDSGNSADIQLAYCPERVIPGNMVHELIHNDRVIGGLSSRANELARTFYRNVVRGHLVEANARLAEMAKLAENAYRDVNIAFANELSMLCDELGVDASELIRTANRHPRVNILNPGPGVGGHCIAVDPWFLVASSSENTPLIQAARAVNLKKTRYVVNQVKLTAAKFGKSNADLVVACLGASYKPDSDDLRESPALSVIKALIDSDFTVFAADPCVTGLSELVSVIDGNAMQLGSLLDRADVVCVLVRHTAFIERASQILSHPCVIDTVGLENAS